jgi:hypothetical protein
MPEPTNLAAGKYTPLAELFQSIVHVTIQRTDGTAGYPDGGRHIRECTSGLGIGMRLGLAQLAVERTLSLGGKFCGGEVDEHTEAPTNQPHSGHMSQDFFRRGPETDKSALR